MAAVDEDLLLHSDGEHYETLTAIDEDALLGVEPVTRKSTCESVDSISQIDSIPLNEQKNSVGNEDVDSDYDETRHDSDKEELDYDEDDDEEEKRERTSRYASEKRKENGENIKEETNSAVVTKTRKDIPSLFDIPISSNPLAPKIGQNARQPIAVKLKMDGGEQVFLPPPVFPQFGMGSQIVPRLPNGIPLIPTLPNHGSAGFGASYQQQQQMRMAGGGGYGGPAQWDQAVDMFLKGSGGSSSKSSHGDAKRSRRRHRSSSYSSYSSYSSDEYSSRSRSRSNSRSPKRKRERRSKRDESRKERRRRDGGGERKRSSYDERKRRDQQKSATIESAKVLGLSDEYLDKMSEQKRRRDEIIRKKEERRNGGEKTSRQQEMASSSSIPSSSTSAPPATSSSNNVADSDRDRRLKAYLAVNVAGLKQKDLPTAVKRVEQMATELGPIRKCWRSSDDVVSIIFQAHDKAKDFMIKYNNKVLSGLRMVVSLEKKYLNISEVN